MTSSNIRPRAYKDPHSIPTYNLENEKNTLE